MQYYKQSSPPWRTSVLSGAVFKKYCARRHTTFKYQMHLFQPVLLNYVNISLIHSIIYFIYVFTETLKSFTDVTENVVVITQPPPYDRQTQIKADPPTKNKDSSSSNKNHIKTHHVIMCMIFTTPDQWQRRALAVRLTWIKRCDYYAFFYSKTDGVHLQGAYALDVPEGRDHLTAKTMLAYRVSYQQYKDKVDWYLKADDDSYFIMENLRHLLEQYDPAMPHYLGHKSTDFLPHGYNSGGAGYVLSKEAVRLVVEKGDAYPESCPVDGGIEDLDMGRCLAQFRYSTFVFIGMLLIYTFD